MTADGTERTQHRAVLTLVVILAIGAAVRGAYLRDLRGDPLFLHPLLDAELHDYWAHALATGDWTAPPNRRDPRIRETPFFRPPGYPYALSAIYRLTGGAPERVRCLQFGFGLGTAFLAFLLGRRLAGIAAGLAAAALIALAWPLIFFEGELLDAALLPGCILAALAAVRWTGERPSARRGLLAGALAGACTLIRPNAVSLVPVACVWLVWTARRRRIPRGAGPAAAALVLGVALTLFPAAIRNARVSGEFIPVSANGGINLFVGNNPEADGVRAGIPGVSDLIGRRGWTCFDYPALVEGLSRRVGRKLGYGEASSIWASYGWSWISAHPGGFAALTAKRAALFLGPREIGDRDVDLARQASPVLRRVPVGFPLVLALAIAGCGVVAIEARRKGSDGAPGSASRALEEALLLAGAAAAYVATFLPFFFNARYRTPVLAILAVLGGVVIARGVAALRRRSYGAFARVALPTALLALATATFDPVAYKHSLDEWHYQRGTAFRDAGRSADAVREYEEALLVRPEAPVVRNDLALILRDRGRLPEAIEQWTRALADDPGWFEARFNRAQVMAALGRFGEAIPDYERVLAEQPTHANAHLSLGTALLATGREAEAFSHYREAERLSPEDPMVAFVIGRALLAQGHATEGSAELRRALRLDPRYEPARRALAATGAPVGTVDAPR